MQFTGPKGRARFNRIADYFSDGAVLEQANGESPPISKFETYVISRVHWVSSFYTIKLSPLTYPKPKIAK